MPNNQIDLELRLKQDGLARDVAAARATVASIGQESPEFRVDTRAAVANLGDLQGAARDVSAALAAAGATAYFTQLQSDIISTGRLFEDLKATLETTLGSPELADAAVNQIADFAARTPFQVEQVQQAYISLKQRGIDPTTEALRALGDISSSQGKGLQQIVEAILDASVNEFERLKEFGIQASRSGDQVSLSFRGVQSTVAATPQAISAAILAFGELEGVAGGMERRSQTLSGQLSNLEDNTNRLKASLASLIQGPLTAGVAALNSLSDVSSQIPTPLRTVAAGTALAATGFVTATAAIAAYNLAGGATILAEGRKAAALVVNTTVTAANSAALTANATVRTAWAAATQAATAIATGNTAAIGASTAAIAANTGAIALAAAPVAALAAGFAVLLAQLKANDLKAFNDAIDQQTLGLDALQSEAFEYATRLREIQQKQAQGIPLTQDEVRAQANYRELLRQVIKELEGRAAAARNAAAANPEQAATQALVAGQLEKTVQVLKGVADGTQAAKDATTEYTKEIEDLSRKAKEAEIALKEAFAAGGDQAVFERGAAAASRQALIDRQREIDRRTQALSSGQAQAQDPTKVREEIKALEEQSLGIRGQLADIGVAERRRQIADEERQQQDLQRQAVLASESIQAQQERSVRERQVRGIIDERQAQGEILQIQQAASARAIALREQEISQIQQLQANGRISATESVNRQLAVQGDIGGIQRQVLDRRIQAQQARRAEDRRAEALNASFARAEIDFGESASVRSIKDRQTQGVIDERQAQDEILRIQEAATAQRLALKREELERLERLNQQRLVSDEDFSRESLNIYAELDRLVSAQADQRAQREQQRRQQERERERESREALLAQIQARRDEVRSPLEIDSERLGFEGSRLAASSNLAQLRNGLETRQLELQRQRLEFAEQEAQRTGQVAQAESLRVQLGSLQVRELELGLKARSAQLEIELQQLDLDLKRRDIAAQLAEIDAQAAVDSAQAQGESQERVDQLTRILDLRREAIALLETERQSAEEVRRLRRDALAVEQEIARERLAQQAQARQAPPVVEGQAASPSSSSSSSSSVAAGRTFDGNTIFNRYAQFLDARRRIDAAIPVDPSGAPVVDRRAIEVLVSESRANRGNPYLESLLSGFGDSVSALVRQLSELPGIQSAEILANSANGSQTNDLLREISQSLRRQGGPTNLFVSSPNPVADAANIYSDLRYYG